MNGSLKIDKAERDLKIMTMYKNSIPISAIAKEHNLSTTRIRLIIKRETSLTELKEENKE